MPCCAHPTYDSMCIFCQDEYADGDRVRILPASRLPRGVRRQWLKTKDSCPICKQCVVAEEEAESAAAAASSVSSSLSGGRRPPEPAEPQTPPRNGTATVLTY